MKNNREYILEKAFEQYLINGYEGVSISVLQESLKIGRATLYYYFNSKENLFKEVIEKYFFNIVLNEHKKINQEKVTIPELIEKFSELHFKINENIIRTNLKNVSLSNLTALLLHAYTHYPDFTQKMREIKKQTFSAWLHSVENSKNKGEINNEIDSNIIASIFANIKEEYESGIKNDPYQSINLYKSTCYCLYDLIKNKNK